MSQVTQPAKTHRVYLLLRDRITEGLFGQSGKLPGEQALAEEHSVSRVTVRRAIDGLVADGLVEKRVGSGTYVRQPDRKMQSAIADVSNVFTHLKEMGRSTAVKMLSFEYVVPENHVREALKLEADERVQRSVRVRLVDDEPFSYLTAQVPERIGRLYSREDLSRDPLLELIERSGLKASAASQEISAMLASPDVAEALDVKVGSALVSLTRTVLDSQGRGMEYLEARYRPDRYGFRMDLVRSGGNGARYWSPADRKKENQNARHAHTNRKRWNND
ncbi:GntR family transcriptional regulator [Hoeflea sp. CAU 1731]